MENSKKIRHDEVRVYELIFTLSEEMMRATQAGDWDRVVLLDQKRHQLIDTLRDLNNKHQLQNDEQLRKTELIKKILATDTQTQGRVQGRMSALKTGFETERKLLETYSSTQAQAYRLS